MGLTLQQLWNNGRKRLEEAKIFEHDLDARYLLLEAFQMDMAHFLIKRNEKLDMEDARVVQEAELYNGWIERRSKRIPLQHLSGKQEFMGLEFSVNEHVLIPRQDTETLVELVMERCTVLRPGEKRDVRLLDMCTGSGCIAVSLGVLGGYRDVTAVDISRKALETAYGNAEHCLEKAGCSIIQKMQEPKGIKKDSSSWKACLAWTSEEKNTILTGKFTLMESDLFQNLDKFLKYDIIVSNPPYIASKVIEGLEPEVRDYEPRLALDGAEDGLYFYRRLAKEGKEYLAEGGDMFLEIGYDQGEAVTSLLEENGFINIEVIKDGAGLDRVVHGSLPSYIQRM